MDDGDRTPVPNPHHPDSGYVVRIEIVTPVNPVTGNSDRHVTAARIQSAEDVPVIAAFLADRSLAILAGSDVEALATNMRLVGDVNFREAQEYLPEPAIRRIDAYRVGLGQLRVVRDTVDNEGR